MLSALFFYRELLDGKAKYQAHYIPIEGATYPKTYPLRIGDVHHLNPPKELPKLQVTQITTYRHYAQLDGVILPLYFDKEYGSLTWLTHEQIETIAQNTLNTPYSDSKTLYDLILGGSNHSIPLKSINSQLKIPCHLIIRNLKYLKSLELIEDSHTPILKATTYTMHTIECR